MDGRGGGIVGGIIGSVSAATVVRGAARRGATTGGTAFLLLGVAVVVCLLALIPVVGFIEAIVLPVLLRGHVRPGEVRRSPLAREVRGGGGGGTLVVPSR